MYEYLRIFAHLQKINIFYTVKKHKNHNRVTSKVYNENVKFEINIYSS